MVMYIYMAHKCIFAYIRKLPGQLEKTLWTEVRVTYAYQIMNIDYSVQIFGMLLYVIGVHTQA